MRKKIFKSLIAAFAMMAMFVVPVGVISANATGIEARICTHTYGYSYHNEYTYVDYTSHINEAVEVYACTKCGIEKSRQVISTTKEAHFDAGDGQCECGQYVD